jgi:hypothetical protein
MPPGGSGDSPASKNMMNSFIPAGRLNGGSAALQLFGSAVLKCCSVAVKQGINRKFEALNARQYLNPNAQTLNVLVI